MNRQHDAMTPISPGLDAKLRRLAAGLTATDEAELLTSGTGDLNRLSPALQDKVQGFAASLTDEEAGQARLLFQVSGVADPKLEAEVTGHAAALYEGDPGNKGRPQPGATPGATGRDPSGIVTATGYGLLTLLSPIGNWLQDTFPRVPFT